MIGCRRAEVVAVLKVDFQNDGCVDEILQSAKSFPGVEEVKIDRRANKLTAIGTMDPQELQDFIEKKTQCKAEVLCSAKEKKLEVVNSAKEHKAVRQANIIVLKVDHHCDGCISRIRRTILKINGVEEVTMDRQKNHVTVKGTMKKEGFADYVAKKIRKDVEVVEPEKKKMPSDENPKVCAVM